MTGDVSKMVIGLVMIAVAFIVFPIILTGANTILTDANITDYTGLSTLVRIAPLLVFIGLLLGGGVLGFAGARSSVRRSRGRKASR